MNQYKAENALSLYFYALSKVDTRLALLYQKQKADISKRLNKKYKKIKYLNPRWSTETFEDL